MPHTRPLYRTFALSDLEEPQNPEQTCLSDVPEGSLGIWSLCTQVYAGDSLGMETTSCDPQYFLVHLYSTTLRKLSVLTPLEPHLGVNPKIELEGHWECSVCPQRFRKAVTILFLGSHAA